MALVAKMDVLQVQKSGGGRIVPCGPDDEGAVLAAESNYLKSYTDPPQWLVDAEYLRVDPLAQASEYIKLHCVSYAEGKDPEKTNAQWAMASPSGNLDMVIMNPAAFGYVEPGFQYRVTIERIRGPRKTSSEEAAEAWDEE